MTEEQKQQLEKMMRKKSKVAFEEVEDVEDVESVVTAVSASAVELGLTLGEAQAVLSAVQTVLAVDEALTDVELALINADLTSDNLNEILSFVIPALLIRISSPPKSLEHFSIKFSILECSSNLNCLTMTPLFFFFKLSNFSVLVPEAIIFAPSL